MGKAENNTEANTIPAVYQKPETFRIAPVSGYGAFLEYCDGVEKIYDRLQNEYMSMDVRDEKFPKKIAECEDACRTLIMTGAALFGRHDATYETKEKALEILDRCRKDSGVRVKNLELHLELAEKDQKLDPDQTLKLIRELLRSHRFHLRAYNTQQQYLKKYVTDPNYMTPELREEKEVSAIFAEQFKRIPKGHHFLPARPFPPMRIPEGEEVPYPPEPFCVWKDLPIEDFIYDEDHDEFVLPKGYVNEEMRIDDQSVV